MNNNLDEINKVWLGNAEPTPGPELPTPTTEPTIVSSSEQPLEPTPGPKLPTPTTEPTIVSWSEQTLEPTPGPELPTPTTEPEISRTR